MIRAISAVPLIALATVALGTPALLAGLVDRSGPLWHGLARTWSRLVLGILGGREEA